MPDRCGLCQNSGPAKDFFQQPAIAQVNAIGGTKLNKVAATLETGLQQDKDILLELSPAFFCDALRGKHPVHQGMSVLFQTFQRAETAGRLDIKSK